MIELTGISLCERQKELNTIINNTTKKKTDFEIIKSQAEKSDIDKLYKIGIALKYKNVDYILEIFKSGDSLYISKALKCSWLHENKYSHIINPEYLHKNIFSLMSLKMTKKFLTTISIHMNEERAKDFYVYCIKMKYTNVAIKFLIYTSESFKLEILKDKNTDHCLLSESEELLMPLLGNSFDLATAYYNLCKEFNSGCILYQLRHFYFLSEIKYFEICNVHAYSNYTYNIKPLGLRISKDIMTKHKDEIYKKPLVYLYLINKRMLTRYSNVDDAKFYLKTLICHECLEPKDFWKNQIYDKYNCIIEKIPLGERMQFIQNIFNTQYPQEKFETIIQFYDEYIFKLMAPEEREKWALRIIESGLEPVGRNKISWYRFLPFNKAFTAIKTFTETFDIDTRTEAMVALAESAETECELNILFDYYYKRHMKEHPHSKQNFIMAILTKHNVYDFSTNCWDAFNKILINAYESFDCVKKLKSLCHTCRFFEIDYKYVALIRLVIYGQEVPDTLVKILDSEIDFYKLMSQVYKLSNEKGEMVYQYLLKFYMDKITIFDYETYRKEEKSDTRLHIESILRLMSYYKKPTNEIPEMIMKCMKLYPVAYKHYFEDELTENRLIGYLKKDKELVESKLPLIKHRITENDPIYKIHNFLKILRIYFSNDLATVFLKFYTDIVHEQNTQLHVVKAAVNGIMVLADIDFKKDFINKYVPTDVKIDHIQIDQSTLYIQTAICTMACHSRPPIPLPDIMNYIRGDYVHFCSSLFNSYLNKLPKPLNMEFVKCLLDAPVSIQKHGLRLAFRCFSVEDLKELVLQVWEKTKNISLRTIIYSALHDKIADVDEGVKDELFEVLKLLTSGWVEDDNDKLFQFIVCNSLPKRFMSQYLEVAWNALNRLPERSKFTKYKNEIIIRMVWNIHSINKEVIESIIYSHVNLTLKEEEIKLTESEKCRWRLLHTYVSFFTDDDDFCRKSELVMFVVKEFLKLWDKEDNNEYKCTLKKIILNFVNNYVDDNYQQEMESYARVCIIFEQILKELQDTFPFNEIYGLTWKIRLSIVTRKQIYDVKQKLEHNTNRDLVMKESIITNAKVFVNLLIGSIQSRKCYVSFFDNITFTLERNLDRLLNGFILKSKDRDIEIKNAFVIVCVELLQYNSFETYLFALKLLPKDMDHNIARTDYLKVINELKSCQYDEIKCHMYKKFVSTDYIYRDFIVPQSMFDSI